jgi:hypothetical protein
MDVEYELIDGEIDRKEERCRYHICCRTTPIGRLTRNLPDPVTDTTGPLRVNTGVESSRS